MSRDEPLPRLMRPGQAAEALDVDTATLAQWARDGRIESITLPSGHRRYRADVIEAIVRGEQR